VTELLIRLAELGDSKFVFDWRNDPDTRAASLTTDEVLWAQHEPWFAAALQNPGIVMYMATAAGAETHRIAMCRFNISPAEPSAEISINLSPDFRGQGLAAPVLKLAVDSFVKDHPNIEVIVAVIRSENIASRKIFGSAGFVERGENDGVVTAIRNRQS